MANEMIQALNDLEREKGIKKDYMLERIAQALAAAYKALYKRDTQNQTIDNVDVRIDPESGEITMHAIKQVVEGLYHLNEICIMFMHFSSLH